MFKHVRIHDAILKFYQRSQPIAFSNAETLYDDLVLLRDQILMYGDLSEAQTNYLNEFIEKFDTTLSASVRDIFEKWLNDGFLVDFIRDLINEEVVEARDGEPKLNLRLIRDKQDSETEINLLKDKDNHLTDQLEHTSLLLESQRSVKEFLCDDGQYVKGDGVHDDTSGIKRAIAESNNLFFPEGLYKTTETLTVFSPENKSTVLGSLRFMGKKIDFNAGARIMVHENVDGMIVKGNSTHFVNLTIDVSVVGPLYTKSALVLLSDDFSVSCNANVFDTPKLLQANTVKTGTAIELRTKNLGYIYRNKFINFEIWQFENGIRFNRDSTMGINTNSFQGAIWASKQLIYCAGGGNSFDILGQATQVDDDTACVYVAGSFNTFDGFIFDVGNSGLNKYAYEFGELSQKNTVTSWYAPNTIKNDFNRKNFILSEAKDVQLVLPSVPTEEFEFNDYSIYKGHEIPKSRLKMISGLNNSLGRDLVDTITATAENLTFSGINPTENPNNVKKLFDHNIFSKLPVDIMRFRQTLPDLASALEITFNLKDTTHDFTSLSSIGVILMRGSLGVGDNTVYTVTGTTEKGDIINYSRFGGEPVDPQIDKHVLFEDKTRTVYYQNKIVSFTIRLNIKPNALPTTSFNSGIVYLYANAVDTYGSNSSFPYIGGDTYTGDIEFHDRDLAGVVLKSPTGGRYRLMVDGEGTLSTIKL